METEIERSVLSLFQPTIPPSYKSFQMFICGVLSEKLYCDCWGERSKTDKVFVYLKCTWIGTGRKNEDKARVSLHVDPSRDGMPMRWSFPPSLR